MDEAIIAGFTGSFLPCAGSGHVGARRCTDAGGERGDGGPLGAGMANAGIDPAGQGGRSLAAVSGERARLADGADRAEERSDAARAAGRVARGAVRGGVLRYAVAVPGALRQDI